MNADDRYYLRREVGTRWFDFPWSAYRGADYPFGKYLSCAMTRRGALRIIRRDQRRRTGDAVKRVTRKAEK